MRRITRARFIFNDVYFNFSRLLSRNYNSEIKEIMAEKSHPQSIKIPETIEVFANLKNAKRFAIDIGETCHVRIIMWLRVNFYNDLLYF